MNKQTLSEARLRFMNKSRSLRRPVRGVIALLIATAVPGSTVIAASSSKTPNLSMGTVKIEGTVTINGQTAMSGQTLFSRSNVVTSVDSESLISFNSLARLKLGAATDLNVDSSRAGISGSLHEGEVFGSLPQGILLDFKTADAAIVTDAREAVVFRLQSAECSGTTLFVQTGSVKVHAAGETRTIKAGESFSTSPGSSLPQGSQNNFNHKKRVGLLIGIGATVGIILGVALGKSDKNQSPFGGCVIAPSGDGGPGQCS